MDPVVGPLGRSAGERWAIEAFDLRKAYDGRAVVSVDSLRVPEGQVLAVLGPNGAGKSTLFRLLALLERPDSGRVRYFGGEVSVRDLAARRRTAAVFQRPLLFQGTVKQNVEYGLTLRRVPRSEARRKAADTLDFMGMSWLGEADMRTLSGGELQRVALARALVLEPEILFLDEPTSNLDVHVRRRFRDDLRRVVRQLTATVILITHDQNEAFGLAHSVAIINNGSIVQHGTPADVYSRPADSFVAEFLGVETLWRGEAVECDKGVCTFTTPAGLMVQVADRHETLAGGPALLAIRPEEVVLEPLGATDPAQWESSRPNLWLGSVESAAPAGPMIRVSVRLEGKSAANDRPHEDESRIVALVPRPAAEAAGLTVNQKVMVTVDPGRVHCVEPLRSS